jgi:DNA-binding NtrC family response regulator
MKHHILLIDDDLAFRKSMSDFLKDEGFHVTATESGDEAIALIRQGFFQFSIALVDYHMPVLSGLETIKLIKAIEPNLTIFTFSGDDSVEAYNSSLESGAVFFIEKDIQNAKLLGLLHRACADVEKRTKLVSVGDQTENQKIIEKIGMIGASECHREGCSAF